MAESVSGQLRRDLDSALLHFVLLAGRDRNLIWRQCRVILGLPDSAVTQYRVFREHFARRKIWWHPSGGAERSQ